MWLIGIVCDQTVKFRNYSKGIDVHHQKHKRTRKLTHNQIKLHPSTNQKHKKQIAHNMPLYFAYGLSFDGNKIVNVFPKDNNEQNTRW